MKHSGLILSQVTQINGNNEIYLFQPASLIGVLPLGYKYLYRCRYDLSLETKLSQSLSISVVPPINPEDSTYRRYAKWQAATGNSEKIYLDIKSKKNNAVINTVECLNFGGVWRETITDSSYLDWNDILMIQIRLGRLLQGDDYIRLTGNYVIEVDAIAKSNLYSTPNNFGKSILYEPTLIVPSNHQRARLHLLNSGPNTVHLAFGTKDDCVVNNCLALPPGSGWNDERLDKAVITSAVWGRHEGEDDELTDPIVTGVEVNWVG